MSPEPLDEREFELVNIVGAQLAVNQRQLSQQMNLSLGMTNMLLRRLVTKGYIRITQLNQKKVQYILTPKGFAEKMRKSVRYTIKTLDSIGLIKRSLSGLIKKSYLEGHRKFYILGSVDLASLIEMVVREDFESKIELIKTEEIKTSMTDGMVLICKEGVSMNGFENLKSVDVIEELAKEEILSKGNGGL